MAKLNVARALSSLVAKIDKLPTKAYLDNRILAVRKEIWNLKEDLGDVKKQIKFLPTKTEFYNSQDKVMTELKTVREEQVVLSGMKDKIDDNEDRLETVEEKLGMRLAA